ncbi:MAG: DegV family protein [Acidimicrobiales bacterium]
MQQVVVVTDSNVCLPSTLLDTLSIGVLPITVHLPGSDHPDGGEHLSGLVYQALDDDQPVKSSPPTVSEYLEAIEGAQASSVVVVTPATEFTAMHVHACLACDLARRRAVAVDSRTATAGQGLVVLAGARAAAAGAPLEAVARIVEDAAGRVDLVASVAELQTLWHRGWVPSQVMGPPLGAAAAGDGPRTLFRFKSGSVEPLDSVESAAAALEAIHERWSQGGGPGSESSVVFHADDPELAARLEMRLGAVTFVSGFSAAMGIHTGRGVVGAAWLAAPR